MRQRLNSLPMQLIGLSLVAVLPLILLGLYAGQQWHLEADQQARQETLRLAQFGVDQDASLVEGARQFLTVLALLPEVRGNEPAVCGALLTDLLQHNPRYTALEVLNPDGTLACSSRPAGGPASLADQPWFQLALEQRAFVVGQYRFNPAGGGAEAVFALPILDEADGRPGVVAAAADLSGLIDAIAAPPAGGVVELVDERGVVLAARPAAAGQVGQPLSGAALRQAVLSSPEPGTLRLTGADGVERIYGFDHVARGGQADLHVVVGLPAAAVFRRSQTALAAGLISLAAAAGLALGLTLWVARRSILTPMRLLVAQAQRVAAGDFSARTAGQLHGEFGAVAGAFDQMAAALAARDQERQAALSALSASEASYRALFQGAGDGIVIADGEGRCLDVNAAACALFGYPPAAFLQLRLADLQPAEAEAPADDLLPASQTVIHERRVRRADGTLLEVEISGTLLPDGRRLGLLRDVTMRRRLETALREAEAFLAGLLEQLPAAVFVSDVDGRMTLVNRSWEQVLDLKRAHVLGQRITEFLPPAVTDDFLATTRQVAATGMPLHFEWRLGDSGAARHFQMIKYPLYDAAGRLEGVAGIALNITDRVAAEAALRRREEQFRLINELTSDFTFALRLGADGAFWQEWSLGTLERISGYSATELAALDDWLKLVHPEDQARLQAFARERLHTGTPGRVDFRALTKLGAIRDIQGRMRPLADEAGQYTRLLGSVQDVTEQRQAEAALRLTQFTVDNAGEAIYWIALDGRVVAANDAAGRMLGYSRGELLTKSIGDLDPNLTPALWVNHSAMLKSRRTLTWESEQVAKSGRHVPVEIAAVYVEFGAEALECAFVRDISERRRMAAEQAAQVAVSRLFLRGERLENIYQAVPRVLAEHLHFPIASVERYDEAAGEMVFLGAVGLPAGVTRAPLGQTLSGLTAITGQPLCELHADQRPEHQYEPLRALGVKTALCAPIHGNGRVWGTLSLQDTASRPEAAAYLNTLDVIAAHLAQELERERAEADVLRARDFYLGLLENFPLLVWRADAHGVCDYFNQTWLAFTGRPLAAAVGRGWESAVHPDDCAAVVAALAAATAGRQTFELEYRLRRADGEYRWVLDRGQPFFDPGGRLAGYLGVAYDHTERRQAELLVRRMNAELEQRVAERTARLEAINSELEAFSYSVSHDLRAPLRAINGFAGILAERYTAGLEAEGRHYLANIVSAGERMSRLIDDLLAYARLGRRAVRPRPVALAEVLAEVLTELEARTAESGGRITVQPDLPAVLAEPGLLRRILTNLIENALIYRRPGQPPVVQVAAQAAAGRVVIAVTDNGLGIPAEYQATIFEMFQRLHGDDDFPGTGLGLAIVRKAVHLLGGEIRVESAEGAGSTFRVTLAAA